MRKTLLAGLVSGVVLGVLLTALRYIFGYPLDRILLDVSMIAVLKPYNTLLVQWAVHLVIAVLLAFFYRYVFRRFVKNFLSGVWFGTLVSLIYFVITPMVAPSLLAAGGPFFLWWVCHVVYGMVVARVSA